MAKDNKNHCSFCGRAEDDVNLLFYGISGFICDECAEIAHNAIEEYETLHAQYEEMCSQRDDVQRAVAAMEKSDDIEADFVRQIFGSDHVAVQTAVSEIGTKSFHLIQRVVDTDTQETKCVCQSVMVTFDLEKHESVPLREEWVEAICRYEGRDLRKKKA